MHKPFYASGFLFHLATEQILLQQLNSEDKITLSLFSGKSPKGTDPKVVFQQCVEEALGVAIPPSSIHPVYDYVHDKLGEHFIFYVEVKDITPEAYTAKNKAAWFSLAKLSKQAINEQTRHDIIVGERVIRSLIEAANPTYDPKRRQYPPHSA